MRFFEAARMPQAAELQLCIFGFKMCRHALQSRTSNISYNFHNEFVRIRTRFKNKIFRSCAYASSCKASNVYFRLHNVPSRATEPKIRLRLPFVRCRPFVVYIGIAYGNEVKI